MSRIYVDFNRMKSLGSGFQKVSSSISEISSDFQHTINKLDWDVRFKSDIDSTAKKLSTKLHGYNDALRKYDNFINNAYGEYLKLDQIKTNNDIVKVGAWEKFIALFHDKFGWHELLKGSNYIGKIYDFIQDVKNGTTWQDLIRNGVNLVVFMQGAVKTYNNYMKIGNAVGKGKALAWWAKNITGLKSLGRVSTAKNTVTRFVNNLTNKTSPFNAQIKEIIGDFKGTNGVGKAVLSWGAVAVNGVLNWFDNKEEQKESGGKMSDERVVAETVTETAVGTVLTYGAGIVVGAAVTTVMGSTAVPAIVVVALTSAVIAEVDAGVEAITGKCVTEWISDTILDGIEKKISSDPVTNAAKSIGKWFSKLSFG